MNSNQRLRSFSLIPTLLIAAMLAVPGAAFAQDQLANPSAAQYEPQSQVQGTTGSGSSGSAPAVASTPTGGGGSQIGSLPFTGMDLAIVAGVALLLTGTGLALHRLSVPPRPRG